MTILFVQDYRVGPVLYRKGLVADLPDKTARELIESGVARERPPHMFTETKTEEDS